MWCDCAKNPEDGYSRLKRWIMIGDHHQLPPVIKNMAFQKFSNMEQSLFTRFVHLGVPTVDLDAQGRARPRSAWLSVLLLPFGCIEALFIKSRPLCTRCGLLLQMSHVAWSVCLCVADTVELCKNGWTDLDAVWGADSYGSRGRAVGIKIGWIHLQSRGVTRRWYCLLPIYFGHLFRLLYLTVGPTVCKSFGLLSPPLKVMGGDVFTGVSSYIGMFVNNFLAPIQVRLSPNFISHTLGHWTRWLHFGRSRSVVEVCALLNALLVCCVVPVRVEVCTLLNALLVCCVVPVRVAWLTTVQWRCCRYLLTNWRAWLCAAFVSCTTGDTRDSATCLTWVSGLSTALPMLGSSLTFNSSMSMTSTASESQNQTRISTRYV